MNLFDEMREKIGTRPVLTLNGRSLPAVVPSPYIRLYGPGEFQVEFLVASNATTGGYVTSSNMTLEEIFFLLERFIDDPEAVLLELGWEWTEKKTAVALSAGPEKTETIRANINLKDFFKKKVSEGLG